MPTPHRVWPDMVEGIVVGVVGTVVATAIVAAFVWLWRRRAAPCRLVGRIRAAREAKKAAAAALLLEQRRQEVRDRATKQKVRIALSRSGTDPVAVTYSLPPSPWYHFRSIESQQRAAAKAPSVYLQSNYHPPKVKCLSEMSLDDLDAWLAKHPE